ncbi:hypothetical protein H257_04303 [Aphanomyces astaci]|uniref:Uncharacterized protein n=1 Tax=Aphanomyces astaci TaxID=112090 RepID=W4GV73_APHAT|nr:hypothetical protein H257_04303 [Aphanomyces astaci]ETV83610.1 hypothetical protein H257_04303 [Aphanomyces astaci]|eukprot:XP_009827040.1 hypothetical protein H257_04303 [Aphanomyces astaci]
MPKETALSSPRVSSRPYAVHLYEHDPANDEIQQTLRVKPETKSALATASVRRPPGPTVSGTAPSSTGTTSSLVAKIRKQAKELSELHEELATKEKTIQKLQQSRLHGGGGVAAGVGGHKGKEVEEWKTKYLKEQKKYDTSLKKLHEMKAALDMKDQEKQRLVGHFDQFDQALRDLRNARARCEEGGADTHFTSDEERMYVRLLEEGMQVKAEEFNVSGHAELMVVLAELRQTIQGQAEKLRAKDQQILALQVEKANSMHTAHTDVESTTNSLASMTKQKEAIIDYAQSLSDKHSAMDSQNAELTAQVATLNQLHEHTAVELKSVAERYATLVANFDAVQLDNAALKQTLAQLQGQSQDKDARLAALYDECQAARQQVRDMKTLQDDLLNGIGDAKDSERKWKDKADASQRQLDDVLIKLTAAQHDVAGMTHQQSQADTVLSTLKGEVESLKASVVRLQQDKDRLQTECDHMREYENAVTDRSQHRKSYTAVAESERTLRADLHMIDMFVHSTPHHHSSSPSTHNTHAKPDNNEAASSSFVEWYIVGDVVSRVAVLDQRRLPPQLVQRLPRFSSFLNQVFVAVDTLIHHVSMVDTSWKRERFNLVAARDAFESSAALIQTELDMMRQWSFQLHDELQHTSRAKVEIDQQYQTSTAVAKEASERAQELEQSYAACLQTLRTTQAAVESVNLELTQVDCQRHALAAQVEDLAVRLEKSQQEVSDLRSEATTRTQSLDTATKQLQESQTDVEKWIAAHARLNEKLKEVTLDAAAHDSLVEECAALKQKVAESDRVIATVSDDQRRHLDAMQTHSKQLEAAIWEVFSTVQSHLPKSQATKPDDATTALRHLPILLERIVQHQIKTLTHESMKVALLQNCQSVDYQDPSLCLLRELKTDLQQLTDENQALKAQLSDCRADYMTHLYAPPREDSSKPPMPQQAKTALIVPRTQNNADIVDALRKKLKAKATAMLPINQPRVAGGRSHATADEYVANTRASSLDEQLDQLHAAFASFRTDV